LINLLDFFFTDPGNIDMFDFVESPNPEIFFKNNKENDLRLGEIVPKIRYETAEIVIIGYPQDEGVRRNGERNGTSLAPDLIRRQFYQLTPFGISKRICDLGNVIIDNSLEDAQHRYSQIAAEILRDGKKVISLGGGGDLAYADGCAMSENFGNNWVAININSHFNADLAEKANNRTAYRQLLDEKLLHPDYFYEIGYQNQLNSTTYFNFLQRLNVNIMSLEQLRSTDHPDQQVRDLLRDKFIHQSSSLNVFFGFSLNAVRAADAPGSTAPSPIGLRAGEFLTLVRFAAGLANTKILEFTDVNPNFDADERTTKLVALAMHRVCAVS
jgi:formiminoglutamase